MHLARRWICDWKDKLMIVYIFIIDNKSHEKTKNQQLLDSTIIVFVAKGWYISFLCATELRCCPKTLQHTSEPHCCTVIFLHYHVFILRWSDILYICCCSPECVLSVCSTPEYKHSGKCRISEEQVEGRWVQLQSELQDFISNELVECRERSRLMSSVRVSEGDFSLKQQ